MHPDLWRFAEALYRRPGVETACLQLQAQGNDICLLLCGAWLGRRNVACSTERADCLRALAQPWQREVISALRHVRQQWRTAAQHDSALAALREQIKQLELAAERELLQRLASCCHDWPGDTVEGMQDWLHTLALVTTTADRDALHLLHAAARQV
ncbi:TIGR02444 family protein [Pseudomonas sp. MMS21-TM103]|uniref:TIGR02444 family protein n=1 Tax=Pseudomonas sp. MMS21 TM103 TaxID=2886506 RepID=UPI001EDCA383|nr:TIGR02444 family protein [Pseudomonas sp. MMS21 TM103]MCG4452645.1 TIGR02444 family protein [Pseudomonas sp. MMS21 TM103]